MTPGPGRHRHGIRRTWKSSQVGGSRTPEGCREWGHGDSRGTTAETGSASSSGKKHRCQTWVGTKENLDNIPPADSWSLQKILHDKKGSLSQTTCKKNTENAKLHDLDHKTMQAWNLWQSCSELFQISDKDLNKEDATYNKVSEGGQAATGELNDAQQDEEIAQEQLCNSRDRHDKDFPEMRETMLKVKDCRGRCDEGW